MMERVESGSATNYNWDLNRKAITYTYTLHSITKKIMKIKCLYFAMSVGTSVCVWTYLFVIYEIFNKKSRYVLKWIIKKKFTKKIWDFILVKAVFYEEFFSIV